MPSRAAVIDDYDVTILDLDGVVYLGAEPVPGVPDAIASLQQRGARIGYVTNNAARTPEAVAAHLRELGIDADASDVVTSAQAGARLLADRHGDKARVLALGASGLSAAVADAGLIPVTCAEDNPAAVLQGFDPDLCWAQLTEAALAIRQGAEWVATNTDVTRPTDRGLEPGNGAAVAALVAAVGQEPDIAGKPYPGLMQETIRRLGAAHPIVVGDRLDTDIAGAASVGADSMLVLTGAHGPAEVFAATGAERPTRIGWSVADLGVPAPPTDAEPDMHHGRLQLSRPATTLDRRGVAAVTAQAARACWREADAGAELAHDRVAAELAAAIDRLR